MSGMLFSDRQKFIYCYVMMPYDINYFVTGNAKVNGKMTDKFGFLVAVATLEMVLLVGKNHFKKYSSLNDMMDF